MPHDKAGGGWRRRVKKITGSEVALLGVLATILGVLATALGGLFQFISGYQDRVTNLAKDDLDNATSKLTEAVTTLSGPLALQESLIWDYYEAHYGARRDSGDTAPLDSVTLIANEYAAAFTNLSAAAPLLARNMEIYLDLPDELRRGGAQSDGKPGATQATSTTGAAGVTAVKTEPLNNANLHNSRFDCDANAPQLTKASPQPFTQKPMPASAGGQGNGKQTDDTPPQINWQHAKDNLVTLEYCFEETHYQMKQILLWAKTGKDGSKPLSEEDTKLLIDQSIKQGRRFDDFMIVATYKIKEFRVGYQPNGFFCNVPGVKSLLDHTETYRCTPKLDAD